MTERQAERDPYDEVLGMLSTMRSAQPLGASDLRVYRSVLRFVPIDELREVVWDLLLRVAWRPAPAEVLAAVAQRRLGLPDPHTAWEQVKAAVMRAQGYSDLPGPVRRAAEYVGGPWEIRHSERTVELRKQFVGAYEEFRRAAQLEAVDRLQLDELQRRELNRAEG